MKLAFLIAAHAHPGLLARLVERLQSPENSIFIHIDRKVNVHPFEVALQERQLGGVYWVSRVRSDWGSFGQVKASLALLRAAVEREPQAERIILLSGQDYPLMTPEKMATFFKDKSGVDYFTSAPLPWAEWTGNGGLDRLRRYHFFLGRYSFTYPNESKPGSRVARAAYKACELLLPKGRALPENIRFYGGSNWWSVTRKSAESILEFVKSNPAFAARFRFTSSADEIFFQTALLNSASGPDIDNECLRYVLWDGRRNEYPAILRVEDFEGVAKSGKMFARKMDSQYSLPLLDRIDKELLQ